MRWIETIQQLMLRLRYPVSMPQDIAHALGISLSNTSSFDAFMVELCTSKILPSRLTKFMPRQLAEKAFDNAIRTERFCEKTLISYYFNEGWVEFVLQFDRESRLRRIYFTHRNIDADQGIEIPLI